MATPITWRTINAPDLGGVSNTLARAGQSFNGALDALQSTKDTFETGRTNRNTQAFLDQLRQYQSPEELAAAQESGAIADLRSQFGSLIDNSKTNADAVTSRIGQLREQETADYNYNQMLTKRADQPFLQQASAGLSGISLDMDPAKAAAEVETLRQNLVDSGASERVLTQFNLDSRKLLEDVENENFSDWQNANTRQDRAFTVAERQRKAAERERRQAIQDQMGSMVNGFTSGRADAASQRNQVAQDLGIPVVNGVPAVDQVTDPATLRAFQERTGDIQGPGSATDNRNKFIAYLNGQDLKAGEFDTYLSEYDARRSAAQDLAPEDQAELNKVIAQQDEVKQTQLARLNEDKERFFAQNGYVGDDVGDPNLVAADLIQQTNEEIFAQEGETAGLDLWGLFGQSKGFDREKLTETVANALTEGVPITVDGETHKVRASKGMVKQAFQASLQNEDPAKSFNRVLKNILSREGNIRQWEQAQNATERFREREDAINTTYLKSVQAATAQRKAAAGMTPETTQEFNRRLSREWARLQDKSPKEQEKEINKIAKETERDSNDATGGGEPAPERASSRQPAQTTGSGASNTPEEDSPSFANNLGSFLGGVIKAPNPFAEGNLVREGWSNLGDWVSHGINNSTVTQLPQYTGLSDQPKQPLPDYARETLQRALDAAREGYDISSDNALPQLIRRSMQNDVNQDLVQGLLRELRRQRK